MSHYAILDKNDYVVNVIVSEDEDINSGMFGNPDFFVVSRFSLTMVPIKSRSLLLMCMASLNVTPPRMYQHILRTSDLIVLASFSIRSISIAIRSVSRIRRRLRKNLSGPG